jgi:hypothetical protein
MNEILRDAVRYWERRRIIYNVILALVFLGWIVLTWPHFSDAPTKQGIIFLIVFGIAANVCYSAVYLIDLPFQSSSIRAQWQRVRFGLWLVGTGVAFVFTNYWIADEIYPFVP